MIDIDNKDRYNAFERISERLVDNWSRFGMTRELALIAMTEWNHYLSSEIGAGIANFKVVSKVINYYEKQAETQDFPIKGDIPDEMLKNSYEMLKNTENNTEKV